jgi:hypothetical protein
MESIQTPASVQVQDNLHNVFPELHNNVTLLPMPRSPLGLSEQFINLLPSLVAVASRPHHQLS